MLVMALKEPTAAFASLLTRATAKNGSATPSFRLGGRHCSPGLERNPLVGHLSQQSHFLFSPPWMFHEPVGDIQRGSLPSHSLARTADFLGHHVVRLLAQQRHLAPDPRSD